MVEDNKLNKRKIMMFTLQIAGPSVLAKNFTPTPTRLQAIIIIILLLLLVTMTYNQVQSFQINDYANHYVNIEITECRVLYSKSIAGRGVARLTSWLGVAGTADCFNRLLY